MSLFEFRLRAASPDLVIGAAGPVSWFHLTEGEFWIDVPGAPAVFEYEPRVWAETHRQHATYSLAAILENLAELLPAVAEPVPGDLYSLVHTADGLRDLKHRAQNWLDSHDDVDWATRHEALLRWIYSRQFSIPPVTDSPEVWFFRDPEERVALVWDAEGSSSSNLPLWASPGGQVELLYREFQGEVQSLFARFFTAMEDQINRIAALPAAGRFVDAPALRQVNVDRRVAMLSQVEKLANERSASPNFIKVRQALSEAKILKASAARGRA